LAAGTASSSAYAASWPKPKHLRAGLHTGRAALDHAQSRFGTDRACYAAMLKLGRQHKDRVWAVEGCNGIGRHIAQRLVADRETVLDVPAKLFARARLFDTAEGRKTDPADAHCVGELYAERAVVNKETVPVERVRMVKETVTEQQTVSGDIRKEHIEAVLPNEEKREFG
jgi:hypothetical protein